MTPEKFKKEVAVCYMVGHYAHSQIPEAERSEHTMPYTIEVPRFIVCFPTFKDDPEQRDKFINHVFQLGVSAVTKEFSSTLFDSSTECAVAMQNMLKNVIETRARQEEE